MSLKREGWGKSFLVGARRSKRRVRIFGRKRSSKNRKRAGIKLNWAKIRVYAFSHRRGHILRLLDGPMGTKWQSTPNLGNTISCPREWARPSKRTFDFRLRLLCPEKHSVQFFKSWNKHLPGVSQRTAATALHFGPGEATQSAVRETLKHGLVAARGALERTRNLEAPLLLSPGSAHPRTNWGKVKSVLLSLQMESQGQRL